jgi:hypothetical protein
VIKGHPVSGLFYLKKNYNIPPILTALLVSCTHDGNCDACKACMISEAPSPTDVYIGFQECNSMAHSINHQTDKLAETVE